jgi:hypothetical protein
MKEKPKFKYTEPKLITVYKLNYPGADEIQQYYKYEFTSADEDQLSVYVDACPGCGKNLKYRGNEHKCAGTLTGKPVDAAYRAARSGSKRTQPRDLAHYLSQQTHPIVLKD